MKIAECTTDYIPIMEIDVSLESKRYNKTISKFIIDAKYYKDAVKSRAYSDGKVSPKKYNSNNMYQMYAYLQNHKVKDFKNNIKAQKYNLQGILLYPETSQPLNEHFKFGDYIIHFKTVNLNLDWDEIEGRLIDIIKTAES